MTTTRNTITIDGESYTLADGQDLDALRTDLIRAHHDGGFVGFDVVGGEIVFALVTASSRIRVTTSIEPTETVEFPEFVAFNPDFDL